MLRGLVLSILFGFCAPAATAQQLPSEAQAQAADHWRSLARLDLDAAHALLRDNHPAMLPEIGDTGFIARVEAAYVEAQSRIGRIETYYGYRSMLQAFANAAGDRHIAVSFALTRQYTIWPDFLVRMSGNDLVVVRASADMDGDPPSGSRLISCDGVPAQDFARSRLGAFEVNWDIEAQRATSAWRLFVNDRNPFLDPPRVCRFDVEGQARDVTLSWTYSTYEQAAPVIAQTQNTVSAGYGVRRLGNGAYWISMEQMHDDAEAVVQAAQAMRRELRAAPYVVVDVRGNGGGSSSYGDRLADILLPNRSSRSGSSVTDVWRASQANADAMREFAEDARGNADQYAWADETATMLSRAAAADQPLAPRLPRRSVTPPFVDPPGGAPGTARVYILTDYACFSSCLLMVDTFKQRGAAQIGLPTDAATRYMEVRALRLPSALATFSTLQKLSLGSPVQIGPYRPAAQFVGDMGNTAALEAWVADLATP